jgi:hypothetical protein
VKEKLYCWNLQTEDLMITESHVDLIPEKQSIYQQTSASTTAMHLKRKLAKAPLVVYELRMSDRLKEKNQGFKVSSCQSKSCFCCTTEPPTLSTKFIRSLMNDFCKISPVVLCEEGLKKKSFGRTTARSKSSHPNKSKKKQKCR